MYICMCQKTTPKTLCLTADSTLCCTWISLNYTNIQIYVCECMICMVTTKPPLSTHANAHANLYNKLGIIYANALPRCSTYNATVEGNRDLTIPDAVIILRAKITIVNVSRAANLATISALPLHPVAYGSLIVPTLPEAAALVVQHK